MKEKTCFYCKKTYKPKSNNSKYCSKKCKHKRDDEWRKTQRKNNPEWRQKANQKQRNLFQRRYHNEPEYKKKHNQNAKKWQQKNREKHCKIVLKSYYKNHEKNKDKQKRRHKKNYQINKGYREKILQRNREYKKTENGKIADKKHKAKRRKLGTLSLFGNRLILPPETQPEYAHINPLIGAYLPKTTHNLIPVIQKQQHQENTIKWIQKIYNINLEKILNP